MTLFKLNVAINQQLRCTSLYNGLMHDQKQTRIFFLSVD